MDVVSGYIVIEVELIRSTEAEKAQQIANVARYQQLRNALSVGAPEGATPSAGLANLQQTARADARSSPR